MIEANASGLAQALGQQLDHVGPVNMPERRTKLLTVMAAAGPPL